jgi:putative membrane protein
MKLPFHFHLLLGLLLVFLPTMMLSQSHETRGAGAQSSSNNPSDTMQSNSTMENQGQKTAATATNDKKFMQEAAEGGLAEVELGKLAEERASNQEVKDFGKQMVNDHSKANEQLKELASKEGVTLPDNLSAKDKMLKQRLEKLSGPNFDRAYMENMVKDHKKDVAEFNRESTSGKDNAVKEFAANTLPTLKEHLKKAESIEPNVKTASASGSTKSY